jgi:tetratricopeptide (TPR) repeat protein
MVGRTERLFARGQRALARRDHAEAETLLRAALVRAPQQPHVHLYLALALAEQERLAEAERALAVAIELAPAAFVFRLHHGILLLDAGDRARARVAFAAAAKLAPRNRLVEGYGELIAWAERGGVPSARLVALAGELPESFGARVLLELAELILDTRGPRAMLEVVEPPAEPAGLPAGLWLGALRYRDRLRYAEDLVDRGRFDDAACVIAAAPSRLADPRARALLERARRGALQSVDAALVAGDRSARGALLLRRYELENELGDEDGICKTLAEWRDLYLAAGAPRAQRQLAAAVSRRLAAVDIGRGRYEAALELCAASRAARAERLGLGQRRAARRALEDFLDNALFPVDMRLTALTQSSSA